MEQIQHTTLLFVRSIDSLEWKYGVRYIVYSVRKYIDPLQMYPPTISKMVGCVGGLPKKITMMPMRTTNRLGRVGGHIQNIEPTKVGRSWKSLHLLRNTICPSQFFLIQSTLLYTIYKRIPLSRSGATSMPALSLMYVPSHAVMTRYYS